MKRGTRITVFVASMALTVAGLFAFVGPGHCHAHYRHSYAHEKYHGAEYDHHSNCGQWDKAEEATGTGSLPDRQAGTESR